jgi:hypothetical protein
VAQDARERRRAQRRVARELAREREQKGSYRRQTGQAGERARERTRETRTDYLNRMAASRNFDNLSDREKNSLASAASNASYGRGNPEWESAFSQFYYHDEEG